MAKGDTRLSIIKEGARLIHAKGYNNTGLSDILNAAGIPKGSFYFYFKSKEDFGLAIVDYYIDFFKGIGESFLNDSRVPPLERLSNFMDAFQGFFEKMELRSGCPIGNLTQEMTDKSEQFRLKISEAYTLVIEAFERCLTEAVARGDISSDTDPASTAQFIFNSWEGAIMHMKLIRSIEPLKVFKRMVFDRILQR